MSVCIDGLRLFFLDDIIGIPPTKVAIGAAALVVGAATAGSLAYLYKQHVNNTPPTK